MARPRRKILGLDKIIEKEKMLKKKKVCKGVRNVAMRRVRIFYNDPDATDSSSDDDSSDHKNGYGERVKCVVREVYIPMYNSSEGSRSSVGVGDIGYCKVGGNEDQTTYVKKMKGVRRRKCGTLAAEIRDPIEKKTVWLGTYATERAGHEAYRLKEVELYRMLLALNKNNSNAASSCASEETTGLYSHPSPSSVLDVSNSMQVVDGSGNLVKEAVGPSLQIVDNVHESTKESIRLMRKLVLKDGLPYMEFEEDPILSPLSDHYSELDSCEDFREPMVKKSLDYPFAPPSNFDDLMFGFDKNLLQRHCDDQGQFFGVTNLQMQELEYRPAIPKLELDFELGKDELDWLNGL